MSRRSVANTAYPAPIGFLLMILLALLAVPLFLTGCSSEGTSTTVGSVGTTTTGAAPSTVVAGTVVESTTSSSMTSNTATARRPGYESNATEALAGADVLSLAPDSLVSMLTARREAVNRGDKEAALEFYAGGDLVLFEAQSGGVKVTKGRDEIMARIAARVAEAGVEVHAAGHPVRFGPYVIEPGYLGSPDTPYILVHVLDDYGDIEGEVLFSEPVDGPAPTSATAGPVSPPLAEAMAAARAETLTMAADEVIAVLRAREEAVNRGDGKAAAAFYAENGVLEELDTDPPTFTTGRAALAIHLQELIDGPGLSIERAGHPLQFGSYVFEPVFLTGKVSYILVYQINERGEIEHQWVF